MHPSYGQQPEFLWQTGYPPIAISCYINHIFYTHSTEPGDINTRFDGNHHALFSQHFGLSRNGRMFVNLKPDTVSETMAEILSVALICDIFAGNAVDVL